MNTCPCGRPWHISAGRLRYCARCWASTIGVLRERHDPFTCARIIARRLMEWAP